MKRALAVAEMGFEQMPNYTETQAGNANSSIMNDWHSIPNEIGSMEFKALRQKPFTKQIVPSVNDINESFGGSLEPISLSNIFITSQHKIFPRSINDRVISHDFQRRFEDGNNELDRSVYLESLLNKMRAINEKIAEIKTIQEYSSSSRSASDVTVEETSDFWHSYAYNTGVYDRESEVTFSCIAKTIRSKLSSILHACITIYRIIYVV